MYPSMAQVLGEKASSCPSALMSGGERSPRRVYQLGYGVASRKAHAPCRVRAHTPSTGGGVPTGPASATLELSSLEALDVTLADPTSDPDVQLMLRVRAGEADAFRELFEKPAGRS